MERAIARFEQGKALEKEQRVLLAGVLWSWAGHAADTPERQARARKLLFRNSLTVGSLRKVYEELKGWGVEVW